MSIISVLETRRDREQDWKDLAELLDRVESRRGRLQSAEEAEELGRLYRRTATHLSAIRSSPLERNLEPRVQALVLRAHGYLYPPATFRIGGKLAGFFLHDLPQAVRDQAGYLAIAALLFLVGGVLGTVCVQMNPDAYYALVPIEEYRSPTAAKETLQDSLVAGRDGGFGEKSTFSGMLWQHNVRVSILAFALGALAGIPTALLVLYNALMLGAMSAVFLKHELGTVWFAWLAGHGVTEILAILLAGAAGMAIGHAMLHPGPRPRVEALREAARAGVPIVIGITLMLLIAALLESFFRQSHASTTTRFLVAGLTGVAWLLYFGLVGRLRGARNS